MNPSIIALGVLLTMTLATTASAVTVSPDEMATCRQWVAARLEGISAPPPVPGIEVVSNYDSVQKNARFGKPLHLGGRAFTSGLFCHAPSHLIVRLPGPGRSFEALVGVDSNEQTAGGGGSVIFSVEAGGEARFTSDLRRPTMAPLAVSVPLDGATEFALKVSDGGDGISCDQADWADASITLQDGATLALADLPIADSPAEVSQEPPFSFTYGGRPSSELLGYWALERSSRPLDASRTEHTMTWTDPATGLEVRMVAVEYLDYPTVEWTLHLRNTGASDTPILENIQALDLNLHRGHYGEFTLHHAVGSPCQVDDYAPLTSSLLPGTTKRIGAAGGRPSNSDMPYFSLEVPTGQGLIVAVGWPGQWSSEWTRDADTGLRLRAGQELTHLKLHPGEAIRTPLVVLQFWARPDGRGDWLRAQNVWRQWMLAHNVPRPGGKLPEPELFGCSSHLFSEMQDANEENQKHCISRYLEERIPIGHWWMDAGWYPFGQVGWPKTGTWEVDTRRFPNGLRAISDHAHERGVKTILWFEPERVHPDTWLYTERPQWLLGRDGDQKLLNLGNPEALRWLIDHVDQLMTEQGIDLYRQDFNFDPLPYWRAADAPDRQGMTEMRHVEGYLAYWDALLERHPDMFIDSCASGGRRNDLETMRRAIPLWRTDYRCEPTGTQCCSYGISLWIPLSGTGAQDVDTYTFRSNMVPFTNCLFDIRNPNLDYDLLRKLTGEWRQIAPCFTGDFWPLTPFSTDNGDWLGWQFDRPDLGRGFLQLFRRGESIYEAARLRLRGLDPAARYEFTDADSGATETLTGAEAMSGGYRMVPAEPNTAMLVMYTRLAAQ